MTPLLAGSMPSVGAKEVPAAPFAIALDLAQRALAGGDLDTAMRQVDRALERDARSVSAWLVRAQIAAKRSDLDDQLYALHRRLGLLVAQKAPKKDIAAARAELVALDPLSKQLLGMSTAFRSDLLTLAKAYEKAKRAHAAIRTYQELLALAPDDAEAQAAIERISAAPDPSLAETAKPKDLLEDISEEWIREHDASFNTWDNKAKLERENYTTHTDAGYAVLVRCAEAMEQMNAFYRKFFRYGYDDGKSVPRISLNIFRDKDTYLKRGIGPPVEWSKGHFTGGAVETWIGSSGFDSMVTTLFHEAAHQFISLATNAAGWLNEGLACFFEGCRIQPNGTVLMNMPANGRLFGLARRMETGWMNSAADGIDSDKPSGSRPTRAPTFRIIIENDYQWGPPWYAPTWGVAYFLYNFEDPADGRFVYRNAFSEFIDASGGKRGEKAVENFEQVVLANPTPPTKTLPADARPLASLPKTVEELDNVWKTWILALRDRQSGKTNTKRPYLRWANYALDRKDLAQAEEHFEKGLIQSPRNVPLLVAFASHLAGKGKNKDRAAKLLLQAIRILEAQADADPERIKALESKLAKLDKQFARVRRLHGRLFAQAESIATAYLDRNFNRMAMHVSYRLAVDLRFTGLMPIFEEAVRRTGKSLTLWRLAYNEQDLRGWSTNGSKVFEPYGSMLRSRLGTYEEGRADYSFLTLDTVTSGDFSFEAEVLAEPKKCGFAGLVFGRKGGQAFHCVIFFPDGYVDLVSFYGAGVFKTWRHSPVRKSSKSDKPRWRDLRVDIAGTMVDLWIDDELVVSHEFADREVLQGSFGLITGPGTAQFRSVRYLSRPPGDLAAAIERKIRMEKLGASRTSENGSYMGAVPPWPTATAWLKEPTKSWFEGGYVPTLLVLWSVKQNNTIPIHKYLQSLQQAHRTVGLRIVSVVENDDRAMIEKHIQKRGFPGSIALDHFDPAKGGAGTTMDRFHIGTRFQYPRMLLLDIDQRVVWEGSPGIDSNELWKPGAKTYLDDPLKALIEKRALNKLQPWIRDWSNGGLAAIQSGDLRTYVNLLVQAEALPGQAVPEAARGQQMAKSIRAMLGAIEDMSPQIRRKKAEPAWAVIQALVDAFDVKPSKKAEKLLGSGLKASRTRSWEIALGRVEKAKQALDDGRSVADAAKLVLAKATPSKGLFPGQLGAQIQAAGDNADALRGVLDQAASLPDRWLVQEFLHFK